MERLGDIVKNKIPPIPFQTREGQKTSKIFEESKKRKKKASSSDVSQSTEVVGEDVVVVRIGALYGLLLVYLAFHARNNFYT